MPERLYVVFAVWLPGENDSSRTLLALYSTMEAADKHVARIRNNLPSCYVTSVQVKD